MGRDANKQRSSISTVIDNDDLLGEILLRVALPTSLVRGALVCRRWLRVAADRNFLDRFHDRNPSRPLGFYVYSPHLRGIPKFAPMPGLPLELDAIVRRAGSALDAYATVTSTASVLSCLDGYILVRLCGPNSHTDMVLSPIHLGRGPVIVPPPPFSASSFCDHDVTWLEPNDDDFDNRGVTVCCTAWSYHGDQTISTYKLKGSTWHELSSSAPKTKLPMMPDQPYFFCPVQDKSYLVSSGSGIAGLRPACSETSNLSLVALPDGVKYKLRPRGRFVAWADSADVIYLIKVGSKKLRLRVWLYRMKSETWSLEDDICLRTILADSGVTTMVSQDGRLGKDIDVMIHTVGYWRSAMYVLLQVGTDFLYINTKSKTGEKVYTVTPEDGDSIKLVPFYMIFPPVFPVIKDDNNQR